MAFKREFLKAIGLTEEQISAAMEEHTNVTKYLQGQIDQYKADAEKHRADAERLPAILKELDELKARKDYKDDFDRVTKELTDYKAQVSAEAEGREIRSAFKQVLSDVNIGEKYHDAIMKATDFSGMKRDKDGKLENADKIKENVLKDFGAFRVTTRERGPKVDNPPAPDNGQPTGAIRQMTAQWHAERYGAAPAPAQTT